MLDLTAAIEQLVHQCGFATELAFVHALSWVMICLGVCSFVALMYLNAPYGRYTATASRLYGWHMNGRLAWILQECPTLVWVALALFVLAPATTLGFVPNKILLAMFTLHYVQRTLIFPFLIKGGKPTPFVVFLLALLFCSVNGYLQVRALTALTPIENAQLYEPRFVAGVVLFVVGLAVNIHSDHILRNLRKPGESGYKIPRGGMFELVSGANFFGEIVEWVGFAIAANTLPAYAFAFFTACNIGPRALHHHEWYQKKFENYPRARRALIPFLV